MTPPQPQPEIVLFNVTTGICGMYNSCAYIDWRVEGADVVSLKSGYIEDGEFRPGGWHTDEHLPPEGSAMFRRRINNSGAQLCVVEPATAEPICAVCLPLDTGECQSP